MAPSNVNACSGLGARSCPKEDTHSLTNTPKEDNHHKGLQLCAGRGSKMQPEAGQTSEEGAVVTASAMAPGHTFRELRFF